MRPAATIDNSPTLRPPRADVFIDGQNLYHAIRSNFAYREPNFDVELLSRSLCQRRGWDLGTIYFYTGMPSPVEVPSWHAYWEKKLAQISQQNNGDVRIFNPPLRYRDRLERMDDGSLRPRRYAEEKGVDVRIAIDMVRAAYASKCDAMILISQDTDLKEAVLQVQEVVAEQGRRLPICTAFAVGGYRFQRGIESTEWLTISREQYDACLDRNQYFPDERYANGRFQHPSEAGMTQAMHRAEMARTVIRDNEEYSEGFRHSGGLPRP